MPSLFFFIFFFYNRAWPLYRTFPPTQVSQKHQYPLRLFPFCQVTFWLAVRSDVCPGMLPYCKAVQSRRPRMVSKRGICSATQQRIPILKRKTEKRKMSHLFCSRFSTSSTVVSLPSPSSFWQHFLSSFLFPGCHTLISSLLSVQSSREKTACKLK